MVSINSRKKIGRNKQFKIAIFFHDIIHYHAIRCKALLNLAFKKNYKIFIYSLWEKSPELPINGYQGLLQGNIDVLCDGLPLNSVRMLKVLWAALSRDNPEVVVIPGYASLPALASMAWANFNGKIAILMSESKSDDQPRQIWQEWLKRLMVRGFDAALVGGSPHQEYAISLGLPADRVFVGYDVVDNEHYAREAVAIRAKEGEVRHSLELPRPFFLTVCRFIKKKNLFRLLEAYRLYRQMQPQTPWDLVLCGSGPFEAGLKETAAHLPGVHFPGYKQADALPAYYGLAAAFIMPSSNFEQWGLVVNEAMASGLPVLVSKACGCTPDLVKYGVNGFTFDPYDVEGMARLLGIMSSGEVDLKAMGEASRCIIADWSPEVFADNLLKAVEAAQAAKKAGKWWGRGA